MSAELNLSSAMGAIRLVDVGKRFIARGVLPSRPRAVVDALQGVNVSVATGTIHGLIGPNGSGKSTLLRILATIVLPTSGRAFIRGVDVVRTPLEARRMLGFSTGEERSLYWRLTGRQNLEFFSALHHLENADSRIDELLERLELSHAADRPVSSYSQGMARRLSLARAVLHRPPVLLLDEPVRSLDPVGARHLHELLREMQSEQATTILLATHDLVEAAEICDTVTVLSHGQIVDQRIRADAIELMHTLTTVDT